MLKTVGFPSTRTGNQTIVDGNLVIGTAGKGIDFSADPSAPGMTSELLDDYEEGTWTPAVTSNSGTATTYDLLNGKYTKIGNVVYISGSLRPTNGTFGNGVSFCSISGLPFSAGSSLPRGTVSGLDQSNYAALQYGIGDASGTSVYFILAAGISQNSAFSFSGLYIL
jgi:hypothetical protein